MVCDKQNKPYIIVYLKGKIVEQVNQFKYILNNNGRSEKRNKIVQSKKAFLLKRKLLTSKNVDLRTWKRLIKTYAQHCMAVQYRHWIKNMKPL